MRLPSKVTPASIVYCLQIQSDTGGVRTYVGCTNRFETRLRQHNGEIKGGARCTRSIHKRVTGGNENSRVGSAKAGGWRPFMFAKGFIDRRQALSFEKLWKLQTAKVPKGLCGLNPIEKRKRAVEVLVKQERFRHVVLEYV